jgi:hypothetical protein
MAENKLEDLDPIFADGDSAPSKDTLKEIDPLFREERKPDGNESAPEIAFSPRDMATIGAAVGYVPAHTGARNLNAVRKAEAKAKADFLVKQAEQKLQMRPGAQPAGATAARIMEPGQMTAGDKWASKIGGPGGGVAGQAYENFRIAKTLRPGETLMRSGLVVVPDVRTDLGQIEADVINREAEAVRRANPPPTTSQNMMGALGAASRFLGPNRVIGPLAGAFAGHQAGEGAAQTGIDAALSGLSAAGGAMMASGVPALQIPGAGLAAAPYVGRAIAPEVADLLERFFPIRTGR